MPRTRVPAHRPSACLTCGQGFLFVGSRGRVRLYCHPSCDPKKQRPERVWLEPMIPILPDQLVLPRAFWCPWGEHEALLETTDLRGMRNRITGHCGATPCRRAWDRSRMRGYADRKRAEGVDIYAPYREAAKVRKAERIAAGEELHWRQRYPEIAALTDAKRRGLLGEGELFTRQEIGDRDEWICQLCFDPVDWELVYPDLMSQSLDHKQPLSKEGPHTRENARITHLICNVRRGNRD